MNRLWTCGLSAAAMGILISAGAANADPVKLKLAYLVSDRAAAYLAVVKPFVDAVNAAGSGVVEIVPYPNGQLSHDGLEQVMLVKNGTADIAWVVPGLTPNIFPDNGVFELPGLFETGSEATRTYARILATQTLKGYEDFYVIGAFASEPETVHSKAPIAKLSDLKGLRISFNNSQSVPTFTALGATPVEVSLPAVAEAIGKGQLDAAASPLVPASDFGITKVASYHYLLNTSVTPLLLLMRRATFEALPKAAQDVIVRYSGDWLAQRYVEMNSTASAAVLQQLRSNPARKVVVPSAADLVTARAAFAKVSDAWVARDTRYPALLMAVKTEAAGLRGTTQ